MRGQIDYPFLLVFVVLVCSGFLIVKVSEKVSVSRNIGDLQGGVLQVNNEVLLLNAFVEDASKQVLSRVFEGERKNPSLFFPFVDGEYNCAVLNSVGEPKEVFEPNVQEVLSGELSDGLGQYLGEYQGALQFEKMPNSFEVGVEKGVLTVSALEPAVFGVFDVGGVQVGRAGFRPAVRLKSEHNLENYVVAVGQLSEVASRCSYLPDSLSCARELMPEWDPQELAEGKVIFSPSKEMNQPCYILFLPKQSSQPVEGGVVEP